MVGDLNKLGIALKSLDTMKLGTVGVNLGNVEAYTMRFIVTKISIKRYYQNLAVLINIK